MTDRSTGLRLEQVPVNPSLFIGDLLPLPKPFSIQSVAFSAAPIAGDMIFFPACNAGSRHALSHSTLAHRLQ